MTTYTATRAGTTKTAAAVGWAQQQLIAVGNIPNVGASAGTAPVTTGPLIGDIYRMIKLPKGAVITGGRLKGSRMSSGTSFGSSSLAFNVGFTGAFKTTDGTSYGVTTASNALGNIGCDYAAIPAYRSDSGLDMALGGLLYTTGPLTLSEDCFAQLTVTGSAVSFVSGANITLEIEYYMGVHA